MKIITWNCQGAFRKKVESILALKPDILIIQECEHPDKLDFSKSFVKPNDSYWYSDGGKKGIAVFSFCEYKIKLLPEFNPQFRYILPFQLTNANASLLLFAVWAMNNKENRIARYIGQVWFAINHYLDLLDKNVIIIGDFNSNKIWDYKDRVGSHSDVVNKLQEKEIISVYHHISDIEQGKELHPTFYMFRKREKPYHIDYCFASKDIMKKIKSIEVGKYEDWISISDHMPLIIQLNN